MNDWQPIETAPKNGDQVLIWIPYIYTGAGVADGLIVIADWNRPRGLKEGWFAAHDSDLEHYLNPSHWMPLPEPPEEKA